jgi:hypothetical protein
LRNKIARLNADATLDNTFNVNTTATGNYFSVLNDIYSAGIQADGKIVLTGNSTTSSAAFKNSIWFA